MTDPFVGEIQTFGFNFAPHGFALANGATLAIRQFTPLFSLIGTYYGGNGTTTFQLPNLCGRGACGQGQGPGRSPRVAGETFGSAAVALSNQEMPMHNHTVSVYTQRGSTNQTGTPGTGAMLGLPHNSLPMLAGQSPNTTLSPTTLQPQGGGQPHPNQQPALALTFAIALDGVFPSFN